MNTNQKRLLWGTIGVVVLMLLFPPFQLQGVNGIVLNMGYGFIFVPPSGQGIEGQVNAGLLVVQWLGVLIIAALALLAMKD
jgi:hypothetical protein